MLFYKQFMAHICYVMVFIATDIQSISFRPPASSLLFNVQGFRGGAEISDYIANWEGGFWILNTTKGGQYK